MTTKRKANVVLVYPVVTSLGRDNTGGYEHLAGNIEAYRTIGLRAIVLCRLAWPLVYIGNGCLLLNIVPGTSRPPPSSPDGGPPVRGRSMLATLRARVLGALSAVIMRCARPAILHQRANARFMIRAAPQGCLHIIELNDEFLPAQSCDGYLVVAAREGLTRPQLCLPWPVCRRGRFDPRRLAANLEVVAGSGELRVVLLGSGGISSLRPVLQFVANHPWITGRSFSLHAYGEFQDVPDDSRVHWQKWISADTLDASRFHAALIYYDASEYSEERLRVGFPTKLATYIDWSLPILSNRAYISRDILGGFDLDAAVLEDAHRVVQYAERLMDVRSMTLPGQYGRSLAGFIEALRGPQ
jgi:hypothetical protein